MAEAFKLLPLYLRKEPTRDTVLKNYAPDAERFDVVAYKDEDCTQRAGHWSWWSSQKPTRSYKTVTYNCFKWQAVWLPPVPYPAAEAK
jgi:hypothetical protein